MYPKALGGECLFLCIICTKKAQKCLKVFKCGQLVDDLNADLVVLTAEKCIPVWTICGHAKVKFVLLFVVKIILKRTII
ncbi:hypothetical protein PROSTU_02520 [Providencia stuartii ATCC 25827]|uniref:Uncharacterized protein n=1 Tax=Providencia stuartii ATCC 25827 TaxID=471874 RepID=A0AA86YJH7_PROST|nr:hypothetical protein PROSTU_02520 [Providencia stuartii ATCC 25827]